MSDSYVERLHDQISGLEMDASRKKAILKQSVDQNYKLLLEIKDLKDENNALRVLVDKLENRLKRAEEAFGHPL